MKYNRYVFFVILTLFCSMIFAQNSQSVDNNTLNKLATEYLEKLFQKYLSRQDLTVSDITCTTDWERSSANQNINYYFVEGRFVNFPINGRVLSGRVTTNLAVRPDTGLLNKPGILEADQTDKIILLVDDLLSNELRNSMVLNYINQNFNQPIDISIKNERLEIFPEDIYSYVSAIVNHNTIKYLRIVFKIDHNIVSPFDRIDIKQTQWSLKRADEIFSCPFPDEEQIRKDARDSLYTYYRNYYTSVNGNTIDFQSTSGIKAKSFSTIDLDEATNGIIKLKTIFQYDYGRLFNWKNYSTTAIVTYEYDYQKNLWKYLNIEVMDSKIL